MKLYKLYFIVFCLFLTLFLLVSTAVAQNANADTTITTLKGMTGKVEASGILTPSGPPLEKPQRINAGKGCIINLIQPYNISGTLTGKMELNYRILVKGPCGSPAGTFDEEWIAYGTFTGSVNGTKASGNMSYVANVKAGGQVDGTIEFGQGLEGKLYIYGNLSDGKLSYKGVLK